jgi:hypothetical protein
MAKCKKCGNKISIFEVSSDGLCPACTVAASPAAAKMAEDRAALETAAEEAKARILNRAYESGCLPELPCINIGSLKLKNNNLVFTDRSKSTSVSIQNIASFSLKKSGAISNGSIVVQLQKGADSIISLGSFGSFAVGGELTAIFKPQYDGLAEIYEEYILNRKASKESIRGIDGDVSASTVKTINDLRALKALVDEGILTEEEFTAKKRQVLGI